MKNKRCWLTISKVILLIAGMIMSITGMILSFQPSFDKIGKASIIFAPIINTNPSPPTTPAPSSSSGSSGGGGAGVGSVSIPVYEPLPSQAAPSSSTASSNSSNKSMPAISASQKIKDAVIAEIGQDISDWGEYSTISGTIISSTGTDDVENAGGTGKTNRSSDSGGPGGGNDSGGSGNLNITLPTVRLDKSKVQWGDFIYLSGVSYPKNPITIIVRSGNIISIQTKPQKNGIYRYYLDTSLLEPGVYLVQTRSEKDGVSTTDNFTVGTKNVFSGA